MKIILRSLVFSGLRIEPSRAKLGAMSRRKGMMNISRRGFIEVTGTVAVLLGMGIGICA